MTKSAKDVKTAAKMSEGYGADYWSVNVIEKMTHARTAKTRFRTTWMRRFYALWRY